MNTYITVEEVLDHYEGQLFLTRSINTARSYRSGLNKFRLYLYETGVPETSSPSRLTMELFIRFPAWLSKQGYAKQTTLMYSAGATALLEWLTVANLIETTFSDSVRYKSARKPLSQRRERKLPRTPTEEAVSRMLTAVHSITLPTPIRERNIAFIEFIASTGCRVNEAHLLTVRDVNLKARTAKVTGKGNKERIVFLSTSASRCLSDYWDARGFREKSNPAFARHDDGVGVDGVAPVSTTTLRNIVDEVSAIAGIEKGMLTPHSFRHAFATRMLSETGNLAVVQDLLGHASPTSTRVYASVAVGELQRAHDEVYG